MVNDTTTHIEHLSLVILQPGTNSWTCQEVHGAGQNFGGLKTLPRVGLLLHSICWSSLSKTVEQMDRQTDGLENNTFKFC